MTHQHTCPLVYPQTAPRPSALLSSLHSAARPGSCPVECCHNQKKKKLKLQNYSPPLDFTIFALFQPGAETDFHTTCLAFESEVFIPACQYTFKCNSNRKTSWILVSWDHFPLTFCPIVLAQALLDWMLSVSKRSFSNFH